MDKKRETWQNKWTGKIYMASKSQHNTDDQVHIRNQIITVLLLNNKLP